MRRLCRLYDGVCYLVCGTKPLRVFDPPPLLTALRFVNRGGHRDIEPCSSGHVSLQVIGHINCGNNFYGAATEEYTPPFSMAVIFVLDFYWSGLQKITYFLCANSSLNNIFHYICDVFRRSGSVKPGLHIFERCY